MKLSTQPYKGTRDFYPEDFRVRQYIFDTWANVAESFGYEAYDGPTLEPLDLYRAKTGEEVVNEQTYSFVDRGEREVAMRPEMTPTVARMVAARRQELGYPLRWYSIVNNWRYERTQRGREREFWQLNVDLFGVDSSQAELEIIQLAAKTMQAFGAHDDMYTVRLNSRRLVNVLLSDYFQLNDEQCATTTRLIDKMHKMDPKVFEQTLSDVVGDRSEELLRLLQLSEISGLPTKVQPFAEELEELLSGLKLAGVGNAIFDLTLMRGLDYYTDIVFEVFDTSPENSRAIYGGGRYDGLVGLFGVHDLPAVGFAIGDVTMRDFLETHKLLPELVTETDLYIVVAGDAYDTANDVASKLRTEGLRVAVDLSGKKLEAQIKTADKKGVKNILFVGESEAKSGVYELKNLEKGNTQKLKVGEIVEALR